MVAEQDRLDRILMLSTRLAVPVKGCPHAVTSQTFREKLILID